MTKYSEKRWPNHGSNTTWLNGIRKTATDVGDPSGLRVFPLRFMLRRCQLESIVHPPRTVTSTNCLDTWAPPRRFLCPEEKGTLEAGRYFIIRTSFALTRLCKFGQGNSGRPISHREGRVLCDPREASHLAKGLLLFRHPPNW